MLEQRLHEVRERIGAAARRAGRRPEQITLVAVTKTFPPEVIRQAYDLGLRVFGESYVQEFEAKRPALADLRDVQFRLIGHLQSNKARRAAELFQAIDSVDSAKLARRLEAAGQPLEVLIEVQLSEEESKSGVSPAGLSALIEILRASPNLRLTGLMTVPPWSEDPEASRPCFRRLAELGRKHGLAELSMGMSHDLETAVEEGATQIRVGTALFGSRRKG